MKPRLYRSPDAVNNYICPWLVLKIFWCCCALKTLKAGEPNPFTVGNDRYLKMWNIISQCIQAEIARREGSAD